MDSDSRHPEISSNARELLDLRQHLTAGSSRPQATSRRTDLDVPTNHKSRYRPYVSHKALLEEAQRLTNGDTTTRKVRAHRIRRSTPGPPRLSGSLGTFIQDDSFIEVELPQPRLADPNRGEAEIMPRIRESWAPDTLRTNPLWFSPSIPHVAKYASNAQAIFQGLAEEHREIFVELMRNDWCRWDRNQDTELCFRGKRRIVLLGMYRGALADDDKKIKGIEPPFPPSMSISRPEMEVDSTPPVVITAGKIVKPPGLPFLSISIEEVERNRWLKRQGISFEEYLPDTETGRPAPADDEGSNRSGDSARGTPTDPTGTFRGQPSHQPQMSPQFSPDWPSQPSAQHPHPSDEHQSPFRQPQTTLYQDAGPSNYAMPPSPPGMTAQQSNRMMRPLEGNFNMLPTRDAPIFHPPHPHRSSAPSSGNMRPPAPSGSASSQSGQTHRAPANPGTSAPEEHRRHPAKDEGPDINSDKDYERGHAIVMRSHRSRHPKAFDRLSAPEIKDVMAHFRRMYNNMVSHEDQAPEHLQGIASAPDPGKEVTLQTLHRDIKRMSDAMVGAIDLMKKGSPTEHARGSSTNVLAASEASAEESKIQEEAKYIRYSVRNAITMAMRISSNFHASPVNIALCLSPRHGGDILQIDGGRFTYTAKFEKDEALAIAFGFDVDRVRHYGCGEVEMDPLRFRHYVGEVPWFSFLDTEYVEGPRMVLVDKVSVSYDIESAFCFVVSGEFVMDSVQMSRL